MKVENSGELLDLCHPKKKVMYVVIVSVLHHAFHNNATPQFMFDALTLADRELNAACSEGVAVATRSLSQGEGSCRC